MSFRHEEKLRLASTKLFKLKNWIEENKGYELYPKRVINSVYFDNQNFTMYEQSVEGVLPRKKIRLRVYNKDFFCNKKISKEVKISSAEGKFKTSEIIHNPLDLINLGIYDNNYGLCLPIINVSYERSYYKVKNARLTIDEKIKYKKIINSRISDLSTSDNFNIAEIKYKSDKSINLINKNFPFERIRFSKYCRGIDFTRINYCNEL